MDETIDLRAYVSALIRSWWLIVGAVVLALLIAGIVFFLSHDYEASALVTVPEPTQQLQFDPRIVSNVRATQLLLAYPQLATSDDVLAKLLPRAKELAPETFSSMSLLRDALDVIVSPDGRIVRLTVRTSDPVVATVLANAWADEFVLAVETVYGRGGLSFYIEQLEEASTELESAEAALVQFQATNRQGIVDNELQALTNLQNAYLNQQNDYQRALNDIKTLSTQLESNTSDVVTLSDQLTALSLQLQSFQNTITTQPTSSFQLNISADSQLTTTQRDEQLQRLDALRMAFQDASTAREQQLIDLQPSIFALQAEKQQLFNESERLINRRAIAMETYATLARKVDEERIATRETVARLASRAAQPESPERVNPLVLFPLAAGVAILLSLAVVIALTWWRQVRV